MAGRSAKETKMPRTGGESDKLGNRYEGIWTVGEMLAVASGQTKSIVVEPFGSDAKGIEFIVGHLDGTFEYHSAKRQRAQGEWSIPALIRKDDNHRSILGDLWSKLASNCTTCCFVSSTGANDFRELAERARRRPTLTDFEADLKSSRSLQKEFERLLPLVSDDRNLTYLALQRTRVVLIDEAELTRNVDVRIAALIYQPESDDLIESDVRLRLGQFVLDNLGRAIDAPSLWSYLNQFGFAKRHWAADATIRERMNDCNNAYVRSIDLDLINGQRLQRPEPPIIVEELTRTNGAKTVLASGAAGSGKSCIVAQAIDDLCSQHIPVLVVRMDRHGDARTTRDIGRQMGLRRSPTVVLAGVANGARSVLIIDQLDAVSQASGRNPHLWEVFDSVCREAALYPNMKVVIACREFDLEHDHRLRKLKAATDCHPIQIELLSHDAVDAALQKANVKVQLSERQKEILRTPLHLFLFLSGMQLDHSPTAFHSVGQLFDRYWAVKQRRVGERLGHAAQWTDIIDAMCSAMSDRMSTQVSAITLDSFGDLLGAMLTEHVLIRDSNQIRFFHEAFFDYAFARRFAGRGQRLVPYLLSGEQHLFRRSQVRQILAFLRDQDFHQYITELREILTTFGVRFHVKRLVTAWLGSLARPTTEEWRVLKPLLSDKPIARHILHRIRNNLGWFDLLHQLGTVRQWLADSDPESNDRAVWFLMYDAVQTSRSEIAATLLAPYHGRGSEWTGRLRAYFRFGNSYQSRPIQELFLQLMDDGELDGSADDGRDSWWHRLGNASQLAPQFALECVVHWLDRQLLHGRFEAGISSTRSMNIQQSADRLLQTISECDSQAFSEAILPRIVAIVHATGTADSDVLTQDTIWGRRFNTEASSVMESLLDSLISALQRVAGERPDDFRRMTSDLEATTYCTISYLLLRVWIACASRFGDACISFLASDKRRLLVGYASWCGSGDGRAAISRAAIAACLPFASTEARVRLEQAILGSGGGHMPDENDGWYERLLLEAFGMEHLSSLGQQRLTTLQLRFPQQDTRIPPRRAATLIQVVSPVPIESAADFSDAEWLQALRQYDYDWDDWPVRPDRVGSGSALELSRVLQTLSRRDRLRFGTLVDRMEDDIHDAYFEAILNGICDIDNHSIERRVADEEVFCQLDVEFCLHVVRRLHRLPNRPCGSAICRAFERLADRTIPKEDLLVLRYYALEDADPAPDETEEHHSTDAPDSGGAAYMRGYNSVRGRAARAIAALLFADYARSTALLPIVEQMARDESVAVRTCVIGALLPVLNHDRDRAVEVFLGTCRCHDIVFSSPPFEDFINRACSTHYRQLRPVLEKAMHSAVKDGVAAAARQICLAALTDDMAEVDAAKVRTGSETMRRAAAEVYSYNLGNPSTDAECERHLRCLMNDASLAVRETAADCFRHLQFDNLDTYRSLIEHYVDSLSFPSQHDDLLRRLEETDWQLPAVTLLLADRFIARCGEAAGDITQAAAGDASTVSKLVIRLYTQSSDEAVRTRCLDLIDAMEVHAFLGIDTQLAEHDR